ncbi:MAG: hypothetical protein QN209_12705, partial [Armatimonadota bacterium]|nr:hypothetical protein [Armatimonadota bacterium]
EERRLCYVGFTRAKRHLFLSHARTRAIFGSPHLAVPSRFLGEIPGGLVRTAPTREPWEATGFRSQGGEGGPLRGAPPRRPIGHFEVGARVRHEKFGEGEVIAVEGEGAGEIVTVRFAGAVKRLALSYAPLERAD